MNNTINRPNKTFVDYTDKAASFMSDIWAKCIKAEALLARVRSDAALAPGEAEKLLECYEALRESCANKIANTLAAVANRAVWDWDFEAQKEKAKNE